MKARETQYDSVPFDSMRLFPSLIRGIKSLKSAWAKVLSSVTQQQGQPLFIVKDDSLVSYPKLINIPSADHCTNK
jgi:hypothetical protein